MLQETDELWQKALDDAQFLGELLTMARWLADKDRLGAIGFAEQALATVETLRARATQSSALLGVVLFYGIELEVRLAGIKKVPASALAAVIATEIHRCNKLIAAIAKHVDSDLRS